MKDYSRQHGLWFPRPIGNDCMHNQIHRSAPVASMSLTLAQQRLACEYAPYVTVVYKSSPLSASELVPLHCYVVRISKEQLACT
jgi:hypothetical protein